MTRRKWSWGQVDKREVGDGHTKGTKSIDLLQSFSKLTTGSVLGSSPGAPKHWMHLVSGTCSDSFLVTIHYY